MPAAALPVPPSPALRARLAGAWAQPLSPASRVSCARCRVPPQPVSPGPAVPCATAAVPPAGERDQPRSSSISRVASPCSRGALRTAALLGAGLCLPHPVLALAALSGGGAGSAAPSPQVLHWARECPAHRFHTSPPNPSGCRSKDTPSLRPISKLHSLLGRICKCHSSTNF